MLVKRVSYFYLFLFFFAGSGKVSVLSQAHSSGPQKHRLEFLCVNDEELNSLSEQLRLIEGSENFQCSAIR